MSIVSILGLTDIIWASNFGLSGLKFGPLSADFGRSRLDFGPLEVNFWSNLASSIQFQTSWIRFSDLGVSTASVDLLDLILDLACQK